MRRAALICALWAGIAADAAAHPHVFIEQRVTLLFGTTGLEALRVEWTFDELYSAGLINDFLNRKKTAPTPEQQQAIEQQAFAAVEQSNYFLVLKLDDKPAKAGKHRDFSVDLDGPKIRYRFVLPLAAAAARKLQVNSLDEDWFIDFFPAKTDPVRVEAPEGFAIDCGMKSEAQKTVLGMLDVDVASCGWTAKR
jgi:ABC-type uncharacterized transport system substrate-binding protein